ncbi:helix-turn-helix domain-containing protein [Planctomicrobium sp. SH668]|uniref:cobalamin B12-binding domain-containing protein n=1 Tax=Planctomicrobium sp. SH668 TaxID=3448126 RepID=UPI003F5C81F1
MTPRQVAQAINVSESSLKRWCDQGLIPFIKTAGGHRRLPVNGVLTFLRTSGFEITHPEILGLPATTLGGKGRKLNSERQRLVAALMNGDEAVGTEVIFNLYLAGNSISTICDDVLIEAFQSIRNQCSGGDVPVYQECRSYEICIRILHGFRRALPEVAPSAVVALGGTLNGDTDTLGSLMAELVLRENGWRACSFGTFTPFLSLRQALCDMGPRLCWLCISSIPDQEVFVSEFAKISELAIQNNVAIVLGGKAFTPELRSRLHYSKYCERFSELEQFSMEVLPTYQVKVDEIPPHEMP